MTKLMSQGLYLQYKASSGVYYSHGDCEGPSDMPPSSNRLPGAVTFSQLDPIKKW